MAGDLIRFVDSIASTPTTRLDLNDEVSWWVKSFSAPPPRLRRSMASNAMRDGINVGSSSYDARTLTIELECRKSTQDLAATEIQKLWRELDRSSNVIQYQPNTLTKPVFFRTYRSDTSQLADVMAQQAMRTFTIEVLAEPFALGLRETGSVVINNDPAAGSNGLFADITGILGDVAAPLVAWWSTTTIYAQLSVVSTSGSALPLQWSQAESMTLGTNTTNPGGAADAAMSGSGSTNYVTTSFGTATMTNRLSWTVTRNGTYRALAIFRRSDTSSVMSARTMVITGAGSAYGPTVTVPPVANRFVMDLGLVTLESGSSFGRVGYGPDNSTTSKILNIQASRESGTGTLSWDAVVLLPVADFPEIRNVTSADINGYGGSPLVVDGLLGQVSVWSGAGDPSAGTTTLGAASGTTVSLVGGFPAVLPNATNRMYMLHTGTVGAGSHAKATAITVNYAYWPRYLFVRPVSS